MQGKLCCSLLQSKTDGNKCQFYASVSFECVCCFRLYIFMKQLITVNEPEAQTVYSDLGGTAVCTERSSAMLRAAQSRYIYVLTWISLCHTASSVRMWVQTRVSIGTRSH